MPSVLFYINVSSHRGELWTMSPGLVFHSALPITVECGLDFFTSLSSSFSLLEWRHAWAPSCWGLRERSFHKQVKMPWEIRYPVNAICFFLFLCCHRKLNLCPLKLFRQGLNTVRMGGSWGRSWTAPPSQDWTFDTVPLLIDALSISILWSCRGTVIWFIFSSNGPNPFFSEK